MKIESVSNQPDRAGRYRTVLSDGTVLRLYKQTVQEFGLYPGMELTHQELSQLLESAKSMSAKMRAVRIVTVSSVSKGDLQQRLVQKGEDPEHARQAVNWMAEMQLIDDEKTAGQIVDSCIRKGYGLARAKQALYEKKIPKSYWEAALHDYPEQEDYIRRYLANHLPPEHDPKATKKAVDALLRRGHSYRTIRRVMDYPEDLEDTYG